MNPLPRPQIAPSALARRYALVRAQSLALAEPLSEADAQVQSMPDVSPTKWHLAHVTWFFETFVLERHERGFKPFHPRFRVLFNSYYNQVGEQHPRAQPPFQLHRTHSRAGADHAELVATPASDDVGAAGH